MADKQVAAWFKVATDLLNHSFLSGTIEIDQDIATKNDIEHFSYAVIGVHEIQSMEPDTLP
jgi:hypothetical protein